MSGRLICGLPAAEYQRKWYQANREKVKEQRKEYLQKPEVRERMKEYMKEYNQKPEVRKRMKEYNQKPEVRKHIRTRKPSAGVLVSDFNAHFSRLKRKNPAEFERAKKLFVDSVEGVIDGGTELKVAKGLGVKYEKEQAGGKRT